MACRFPSAKTAPRRYSATLTRTDGLDMDFDTRGEISFLRHGWIHTAGLVITLVCVAILATALPSIRRRFKWSFELFFGVHHAFIALYILTVVHTIDHVARGSGLASRSQCALWLTPPMLLYAFDRYWQNASTRQTHLESVKLLAKPKALVVRLARPRSWQYNCGQYARINVPAVSKHEWHPFRWVVIIASSAPYGPTRPRDLFPSTAHRVCR